MWNKIETAPKDGTVIDLWHKNGFRIIDVWWDDEDKTWTCLLPESDFTHWANLEVPEKELISQSDIRDKSRIDNYLDGGEGVK